MSGVRSFGRQEEGPEAGLLTDPASQVPLQPEQQLLQPPQQMAVLPGVTFAVVLDPQSLEQACAQLQTALQVAVDTFLAGVSAKLAGAIYGGFEQGLARMEAEFDAVTDSEDEAVTVLGLDPVQDPGCGPEPAAAGSGNPETGK